MRVSEKIFETAKRRGIVWPAFEIYGGVKGFFEYGPYGALIKRNIENIIRNYYILEENCFEIETPTLTNEDIWVASGHVENFTDTLVECEKCGEPYRADHLVEENLKCSVEGLSIMDLDKKIHDNKLKCSKCGGPFGKVYDYNLMFKTYIGPGKYKVSGYLRPETAQGTYVPFKRLFKTAREKLPFGAFQIGHSFRNEISPRQGMIRLREFSQAEVQFFKDPAQKKHPRFGEAKGVKGRVITKEDQEKGKEGKVMTIGQAFEKKLIKDQWLAYYLARSMELYVKMGLDPEKLRFRQQLNDERAFYSQDTWDVEFVSEDFGRIELVGIADRSDYDLTQHQKLSGESMQVFFNEKKFVPHVIEVAYGIDRPVYCVLESCFRDDNKRQYFAFPPATAPYKIAVFPLVKKDGLPEKAREAYNLLKAGGFYLLYDESGSIGRRYARVDEVGVPYAVTIDHQTLEDNAVTVRNRDSTKQERVEIGKLREYFRKVME